VPSRGAEAVPSAGNEARCPDETTAILPKADSENIPASKFPSVDIGSRLDIPLVTYTVEGDQLRQASLEKVPDSLLPYQSDFSSQHSAWRLFTTLIPKEQRAMLGQFQVITDGPGGVLSAVEQTSQDPNRWMLEIDIADIPDTEALAFTLLHEFGHLLTLGPSQVPPDLQIFNDPHSPRVRQRAVAACHYYFPGEGCSLPTSYLNIFFGRFWKDLYKEWQGIDRIEDNILRDAKLEAFYHKYRERFVDSYAVTSPSEDIAESWAFYILSPGARGTSIIDRKLQFFQEYPALIDLRTRILNSLCSVKP
jgi:hypothetical protein